MRFLARHPRRGRMVQPWLIAVGSLATIVVLGFLLWDMARPRQRHGEANELVMYCAAGLLAPVEEIAAAYEEEYGVRVQIEADGSGKLLSKIRITPDRGDLYLAGEESYVRDAKAESLVAEVLPVVRQLVVLGVAPENPLQIASVKDLLRDDVRVVLPNPELAAVGKVASQTLAGGQWQALMEQTRKATARVSLVGTVTEAALAVKIGAADAAVLWEATARQFAIGTVALPEFSQTNEQVQLAVLAQSKSPTAALRFARYLTSREKGQTAFARYHLKPLEDADVWEEHPELVLMAGAMLKDGIDQPVKDFCEREGVAINTVYAGCGIHVAQMKAMKTAASAASHFPDAYFACDVSFMTQVQQWFEARKDIARNDMVLVVQKGNPHQVQSIADLARTELRVAVAHPVNSALGALTDNLLKKLGLHHKVYAADRRHPVVHADAGHVLVNQMRAGALDAMIVYRSNAVSNPENIEKYIEIVDMNLPEAIAIQPYAVAKDTEHKYLMRRLLDTLLSPVTEKRFRDAGFHWIADGA